MNGDGQLVVVEKSKLGSILTFVGFMVVIGLGITLFFYIRDLKSNNDNLREQVISQKKLTESLIRASNKWVSKDELKKDLSSLLTKKDLDSLKDDLKTQGAAISAVGKTIGVLSGKISQLETSDEVGPVNNEVVKCEDGRLIDVHGYTKNVQKKIVKDSNKAPVAKVEFNAANKKPWMYKVYSKEYYLTTVVGKNNNGQNVYYHTLKYSVPSETGNKFYDIKIKSSEYKQSIIKNKMFWLNLRLDVVSFVGGRAWAFSQGWGGRSGSLLSLGGDLGISLSSYGPTKVESIWRFFRFGLGYNAERQAAHLSFAPVSLNFGYYIPLITNIYLSPQVAIDTAGGLTINAGIGFQL